MTQYSCLDCREPIPAHPERRFLPAYGYVVGVTVAGPSGVLLRDQFGAPVSYYGRATARLVKWGCSRPECAQHHERYHREILG